ncbi:MAG: flagellar basal body rod protein FlgC [Bdellovibrionales bacterium]|nr:flagellar basal body rod protein FlgC [Bdellovibrionales bacterium]
MFGAMEVLASGLSAARLRVNTVASNIANAETTRTEEGGPYKRRDVVQVAVTQQSNFGTVLDRMSLAKPQVAAVVEDGSEPRKVFQPGHPDADETGYVAFPNINIVTSMTDMISATRQYQAMASAIDSVKKMSQAAERISLRF